MEIIFFQFLFVTEEEKRFSGVISLTLALERNVPEFNHFR